MAGIDVSRSVRFVSLDTHPANNSLVVTYEILVVAKDSDDGHELARRAKRDQLQISISALDNLNQIDLRPANKLTQANLQQLSEEIIKKCPVLHSIDASSQAIEDIQLHLLYLSNRKQLQLYQANSDRPGSSASLRLRSVTPSSVSRLASARQGSALGRLSVSDHRKSTSSDIYTTLCEKELKYGGIESLSNVESSIRLDGFMGQFEMHLNEQEEAIASEIQSELQSNQTNLAQNNLEAQLEGLYGDTIEKRIALAIIRRHIGNDQYLANMNENRLLVCALLRLLQDSDTKDATLGKSILFCLIRFTQFEDIYLRLFAYSPTDPIDPMRVVIDLLEENVSLLMAAKQDSLAQLIAHFYHINSLIVILNNLLSLDSNNKSTKMTKKLIQQHGKRLSTIVVGLFALMSRHIASIIRQESTKKYERLTLVMSELIRLSQSLSIFKEFIYLLRMKSQTLLDALTTILNTLQLCRPGSGSVQQQKPADQLLLVRDQEVLSEIYELEIELLRLINNLIYDTRFKARLLRKSILLKCVLRNLVVFLASSRRSNTLTPFHRSSVLMVPLKSLYELSCSNQIKEELYKSKLITKCLFEYLLSSTADLKTMLDSVSATKPAATSSKTQKNYIQSIVDDDQIVLNPTHASHYIIAIWINLSAKKSAPFYQANPTADAGGELQEPLCEYIELSTQILTAFICIFNSGGPSGARNLDDAQLVLYTHAKLLRNFTQFLILPQQHEHSASPLAWVNYCTGWVERIASLIDNLLVQSSDINLGKCLMIVPLLVECVAILANLIDKSTAFWQESEEDQHHNVNCAKGLGSILTRLFQVTLVVGANMDGEHDDLLLVAINLLGTLARHREICHELKSITMSIVEICNFILDSKSTDSEMVISCLYCLNQLVNHLAFLEAVSFSLENSNQDGREQATAALLLVDKLVNLMMHDDLSASKLANSVLNSLKQFEEQQSLSDSVTCKRRFICYNNKWLNAIRANHDDSTAATATGGSDLDAIETDSALNWAAQDKKGHIDEQGEREDDLIDKGLDLIDDFNQLRTINDDARSRVSTTSSNLSSNLLDDKEHDSEAQTNNKASEGAQGEGRQVEGSEADCDEDDDDYDEEENFSEPDLNVIDPNSMIKHLTNRREFRSEILMRK